MGSSSSSDQELNKESERLDKQHEAAKAQEQELQAKLDALEKELKNIQKQRADDHKLAMEQMKQSQIAALQSNLAWLQQRLITERDDHRKIEEQLQLVQSQIAEEEAEIEAFRPERDDPNTKIVVLIGMTGAGKSTFCNRLCGDTSMEANEGPFVTSFSSTSCTQTHSKRIIEQCGTRITVVDTPGYGDSDGRDEQHCNKLCKYLKGCGGINAFVLIRNGSQIRFDMHFQTMLKQYHSLFGDIFFEKLTIMATRIEGKTGMQRFEKNAQGAMLQEDVRKLFNAELTVPVIPIGLDEYAESVAQFVQSIPAEKFECDHIASPIEKLKDKEKKIGRAEQRQKAEIKKIQSQIKSTNEKLQDLM